MIRGRFYRFDRRIRRLLLILFTTALILPVTGGTAKAATRPKDLRNHWAASAVNNLIRRGVVVGYPDGTFKPDRVITRAEFARMAVKAFGLTGSTGKTPPDVVGHWAAKDIRALLGSGAISLSADGTFQPEKAISRREAVTTLTRLLGFGQKEQFFGENWPATYADMPSSDPDFRLVELARRLGYLPPSYAPSFLPGATVTRAEAAWMFDRILKIKRLRGKIKTVEPELWLLTVEEEGEKTVRELRLDPEALILRNDAATLPAKLRPDDLVLAFVGPDGQVKALKASGKANMDDLTTRLQTWTKGMLKPETVAAILAGNWDLVRQDLEIILFDRLLEMGLTPGEAQSLLARDWVTLDLLSRQELIQALSSRLGISTDLAEAILSRDLARIKEILQDELVALALGRLLLPGSPVS